MTVNEGIAKRRAIIRSNPNLSARELCELFDHRQVPVPGRWEDGGIQWWTKAYHRRRFRSLVRRLILKDRTRDIDRDGTPQVEELLEDTREILRRSQEIIQQSDKLISNRGSWRVISISASEPYTQKASPANFEVDKRLYEGGALWDHLFPFPKHRI